MHVSQKGLRMFELIERINNEFNIINSVLGACNHLYTHLYTYRCCVRTCMLACTNDRSLERAAVQFLEESTGNV